VALRARNPDLLFEQEASQRGFIGSLVPTAGRGGALHRRENWPILAPSPTPKSHPLDLFLRQHKSIKSIKNFAGYLLDLE